ncbi:MAG: cytochrome c biogenesis protein CcsA [Zoogloeaceae bacterium]|nr:cytochrome c biogenesis protein CcsA [Zoogloeaceae bacterium]MCK6383367.1 cytochrome c biogenesis protein CcsA [Rhodocyclaceae bacterium]
MQGILPHLLPASLYAFLGFHFWRTRWVQVVYQTPPGIRLWERLMLAAALLLHGYLLYGTLFDEGLMRFGFSAALSLMLWLAVLIYWVESFHARLEGLQPLALPLAGICALLPALFPGQHLLSNVASAMFRLHFFIAMVAYSLFTLAALHAIIMAIAERRLHRGELTRPLASLPPLLTMESLLFKLITVGFLLLTLTLISGIAFTEALFGKALEFNHKTLFSVLSWLIFAILLTGRHVWGWRGRKALRWTLAGFATLLLAYIGSRFVLEVLLGRAA